MKRILVLDDDQSILEFFRDFLTKNGFEIDTAENGREGLKAVKKKKYDVVLVDVMMPVMDGIEFLEEARILDSDICVIMLSGKSNIDQAIEALKKGASNFITKPFVAHEVLNIIKNTLLKKDIRHEEIKFKLMLSEKVTFQEINYIIPSDFEYVRALVKQLNETAEHLGYKDEYNKLSAALDEIMTNALIHGNWADKKRSEISQEDKDKKIIVNFEYDKEKIKVIIKDEGKGFDHTKLPDPTHPENIYNFHGRGIFITRSFMDEVKFNEKGNEVTLIKYL